MILDLVFCGYLACVLVAAAIVTRPLQPVPRASGPIGPRREVHPQDWPASPDAIGVATDAQPRGRTTVGGLLLWGGTVSIGVSTVILLAVLSRHLHQEGFTGLSTLFGLFFIASLIPSGVPLRAAALEVDGAPPMRLTATHVVVLV